MPDVASKQGVRVDDRAAQQREPDVVIRGHAELRSEGSFVAEPRRSTGHVRAHGDGPEAELIVGQQISREAQQQRQHEKKHADAPVELARRLVAARQHHAEHMQPGRDHHQVRRPSMHVPEEFAERHVAFKVENVAVSLSLRRMVVEHQ